MNLCRKLCVGLVVVLSLGSGICQIKILAGDVKKSTNPNGNGSGQVPTSVEGSFMITNATAQEGGILGDRTGGACVIANLNAKGVPIMQTQNRTCTKNTDCQGFNAENGEVGWSGYCDTEGTHVCWVRPGPPEDLCNRSPDHHPTMVWDLNVSYPSNKSFSLTEKRYKVPSPGNSARLQTFLERFGVVEWRVVACLNGINKINGKPFCPAGAPTGPLPPNTGMEVLGKAKKMP